MNFVMFSKMLGDLTVVEAARRIKALGFDGVDLTVRPGGMFSPIGWRRTCPRRSRSSGTRA